MTPTFCKLCSTNHWARQGCQFAAVIKGSKYTIAVDGINVPKGSILLVSKSTMAPADKPAAPASKATKPPGRKKAKRKGKRK
ncbi:hypothetical protein UFOVP1670_56 [uncultured Caudovirales phage]|uniref:Uncharacterized protein n=1 Tax=uncultured Caudovirales phage TaxID=2100421 RepID=A0A6J5T7C7_9CAUD|nr:hypothetical protein UFOVP1670_56 [uncultured Caudovirales phage]